VLWREKHTTGIEAWEKAEHYILVLWQYHHSGCHTALPYGTGHEEAET